MQQGSSSRSESGRNGGAVEADAIREQQLKRITREAAEVDTTGEADAIGKPQLCNESCPVPDTHVGERRGSS